MVDVISERKGLFKDQDLVNDQDAAYLFAITVLVPTRNEAGNIEELLNRLDKNSRWYSCRNPVCR